jgi:hypothetical protein
VECREIIYALFVGVQNHQSGEEGLRDPRHFAMLVDVSRVSVGVRHSQKFANVNSTLENEHKTDQDGGAWSATTPRRCTVLVVWSYCLRHFHAWPTSGRIPSRDLRLQFIVEVDYVSKGSARVVEFKRNIFNMGVFLLMPN